MDNSTIKAVRKPAQLRTIPDEARVKAFLEWMSVGADLKEIAEKLYADHGLKCPEFVRWDGVPFFFDKIIKQLRRGDQATIDLCKSMNVRLEVDVVKLR